MKHIAQRLYDLMLGCSHRHISRPMTINKRTYCVCCDCGRQFDYSLEQMRIIDTPLPTQAFVGSLAPEHPRY